MRPKSLFLIKKNVLLLYGCFSCDAPARKMNQMSPYVYSPFTQLQRENEHLFPNYYKTVKTFCSHILIAGDYNRRFINCHFVTLHKNRRKYFAWHYFHYFLLTCFFWKVWIFRGTGKLHWACELRIASELLEVPILRDKKEKEVEEEFNNLSWWEIGLLSWVSNNT